MTMPFKQTCQTLAKVPNDEPIFVLRAQDTVSPIAIRAWADAAEAVGSPPEKVRQARQWADEFERWQKENRHKNPD